MTLAPCAHGMPTPASCVDCMQDGYVAPAAPRPEAWERVSTAPPFPARFDGQCAGCNLPITVGALIAGWARGDASVYCHEGCEP